MDEIGFKARFDLAVRPSPDAAAMMSLLASTLPDPEWVPPAVRALFGLSPLPSLVPYAPDPCAIPCAQWFAACLDAEPAAGTKHGLLPAVKDRIMLAWRMPIAGLR